MLRPPAAALGHRPPVLAVNSPSFGDRQHALPSTWLVRGPLESTTATHRCVFQCVMPFALSGKRGRQSRLCSVSLSGKLFQRPCPILAILIGGEAKFAFPAKHSCSGRPLATCQRAQCSRLLRAVRMSALPQSATPPRSSCHGANVVGRRSQAVQTRLLQPHDQTKPLGRIWRQPREPLRRRVSAYASEGISGTPLQNGDRGRSEASAGPGQPASSPQAAASTVDVSVASDDPHAAHADSSAAGRPVSSADSSTTLIKAFHLVRSTRKQSDQTRLGAVLPQRHTCAAVHSSPLAARWPSRGDIVLARSLTMHHEDVSPTQCKHWTCWSTPPSLAVA